MFARKTEVSNETEESLIKQRMLKNVQTFSLMQFHLNISGVLARRERDQKAREKKKQHGFK